MIARRVLLGAGVLSLVGLGWLAYSWVRDSSLVKVRHVQVSGLTGEQGPAIRRALTEAAQQMTTLHVDRAVLDRRVERYPIVRSVSTSTDFPSTLRVTVHEYRPSAVVTDPGGRRVAVAEDGTLLPHMSKDGLAAVKVNGISGSGKVTDRRLLGVVALLGQAPAGLRARLGSAYWGKAGVRVALREGPSIEFGAPANAAGKWLAAARVLADDSSAGAKLIDVRLPQRPVAGGFAAGSEGTAGSVPPPPPGEDPSATTVPQAAPVPQPDPQP